MRSKSDPPAAEHEAKFWDVGDEYDEATRKLVDE